MIQLASCPAQTYQVTRADLVRYAGRVRRLQPDPLERPGGHRRGLPGVIAHGMFTMALAGRAVTTWLGDPGGAGVGVRFAKPVWCRTTTPGRGGGLRRGEVRR
jgi:acyl dehydratase